MPGAEAFERFVATYEALRFGPAPPADALPRLREQARAVLRALRGRCRAIDAASVSS